MSNDYRDPIVDEIRSAREAFAEKHDHDLNKICQALREEQAKSGRPLVKREPKRLPPNCRSTEAA